MQGKKDYYCLKFSMGADNMRMEDLVYRIWYFRNKANISARDLSLRLGKHEAYISKLESKDFNLPSSVLLDIFDILQVEPEMFFAKDFDTYNKDRELIDLILRLPYKKRELLIEYLKLDK